MFQLVEIIWFGWSWFWLWICRLVQASWFWPRFGGSVLPVTRGNELFWQEKNFCLPRRLTRHQRNWNCAVDSILDICVTATGLDQARIILCVWCEVFMLNTRLFVFICLCNSWRRRVCLAGSGACMLKLVQLLWEGGVQCELTQVCVRLLFTALVHVYWTGAWG